MTARRCNRDPLCYWTWRVLTFWCVAALAAFIGWIAIPAAKAVVEAVSARPSACADLGADECSALAEGGW